MIEIWIDELLEAGGRMKKKAGKKQIRGSVAKKHLRAPDIEVTPYFLPPLIAAKIFVATSPKPTTRPEVCARRPESSLICAEFARDGDVR